MLQITLQKRINKKNFFLKKIKTVRNLKKCFLLHMIRKGRELKEQTVQNKNIQSIQLFLID